VVYLSTLRVIYIFIAVYDLEVEVFDIITTYLNADVPKGVIIYIRQLHSLDNGIRYVCRLKKALYSLYSSSKWWYNIIVPVFKEYGFETFVLDICCFINRDKDIFLYLYIDDIIVAAPTKALIMQMKKKLVDIFEMKELGELRRYLDCRIDCNRKKRFTYIF